jgi:multidrug efflux pump subunit AcrB
MAKYQIKVKVSKGEFKDLKSKVKEIIENKIAPDMSSAVKKLLLYRGINPGMSARLDTFKIANAGIIPSLVIDNLKLQAVNLKGGSETGVQIRDTRKGSEVVIRAEIDHTAVEKYKGWNPAAVLKDVANMDREQVRAIVREAFNEAGFKHAR